MVMMKLIYTLNYIDMMIIALISGGSNLLKIFRTKKRLFSMWLKPFSKQKRSIIFVAVVSVYRKEVKDFESSSVWICFLLKIEDTNFWNKKSDMFRHYFLQTLSKGFEIMTNVRIDQVWVFCFKNEGLC